MNDDFLSNLVLINGIFKSSKLAWYITTYIILLKKEQTNYSCCQEVHLVRHGTIRLIQTDQFQNKV
jgi:hypothetical protein